MRAHTNTHTHTHIYIYMYSYELWNIIKRCTICSGSETGKFYSLLFTRSLCCKYAGIVKWTNYLGSIITAYCKVLSNCLIEGTKKPTDIPKSIKLISEAAILQQEFRNCKADCIWRCYWTKQITKRTVNHNHIL
jgi:hypothetical protein